MRGKSAKSSAASVKVLCMSIVIGQPRIPLKNRAALKYAEKHRSKRVPLDSGEFCQSEQCIREQKLENAWRKEKEEVKCLEKEC